MPATIDLTNPAARPARPTASQAQDGKPTLIGMSRDEMVEAMADAGVPEKQRKMRVNQIWHWLYIRGVSDFADMHTISRELREGLAARYTIARPEIVEEQISNDGTRKWLMRFPPRGAGRPVEVETVYIPEEGRGTLCISSQVGCTLTCTFCHTGTQKLVRNLTAEEILSQLLIARDRLGDFPHKDTPQGAIVPAEGRKVTNIVMMGMGEPLYNFEEVKKALLIASDGDGLALSRRRITLSTSGVVPGIVRTGEEIGVMLAISLHAVRDELRDELVPINKKYPLKELLEACRTYPGVSNARRITFEYVMLRASMTACRTPRNWCGCSRAFPPRSISFRSIPGRDRPMNARTGRRSRPSPILSTPMATPRRSARRAAATSWRPAASSRANPSACARPTGWRSKR